MKNTKVNYIIKSIEYLQQPMEKEDGQVKLYTLSFDSLEYFSTGKNNN